MAKQHNSIQQYQEDKTQLIESCTARTTSLPTFRKQATTMSAIFPTKLRTTNIPNYLTVGIPHNKITNHSLHSASICANVVIPLQAQYFYFEIVMENVEKGSVSIGLIPEYQFVTEALLGKKHGYGLRRDGQLFSPINPSGIEWSFSKVVKSFIPKVPNIVE